MKKLKHIIQINLKIYGDIMGHAWDNGYGINYVPTGLGEVNNNVLKPSSSDTVSGLNPIQQVNTGHIERCRKNVDATKRVNSSLNTFLSKDDADNTSLRDNAHQNTLVYASDTALVYQGIVTIPLSQIHDVFQQMPTLSSINGFDLRLQCNLERENTYTMTYPVGTGDSIKILPSSIDVIQSIGKICPTMVANPSTNGSCGIAIQANTGAGAKITAKCLL